MSKHAISNGPSLRPSSFRVERPQCYDKRTDFQQPVEINSYSIDHKRSVWFDDRELKYYYKADIGADLSIGYKEFIERDTSELEHIDTLLDALTNAQDKSKDLNLAKTDIVTWRGIMTKLLCTPYSQKDGWELRATRYNGTIYVEEHKLDENQDTYHSSERQKMMGYWGYKFETLSTVSEPPTKTLPMPSELDRRLQDSANTNVQYCVVVKTKLGDHNLIMGAEVDCSNDAKKEGKSPLVNYVELKTSRVRTADNHFRNFDRFKLLKFWAQSFLIGLPKVICGFRDDDGIIKEVEEFDTLKIPRLAQASLGPSAWKYNVCLSFANEVLSFMRSVIDHDDPTITYSIVYNPATHLIEIKHTRHEHVFLTQRFLDGEISHRIGGPRAEKPTDDGPRKLQKTTD